MKHAFKICSIIMILALLAMFTQPAQAATITDTTSDTATNDGTVNTGTGEYVGSTTGINSGFGGVIGQGSTLHIDSSSTGALNIGLIK